MNVPLEYDYGFSDRYARERCPGCPESPLKILRLAQKIWRRAYPQVIEEGEVEGYVATVVAYCWGHFQPARGNPNDSIEHRFLRFFRYCFRRTLRDVARDRRRNERRRSTARYHRWKLAQEPSSRKQDRFMEWCWYMYAQARRRLSRDVQQFIHLHLEEKKTLEQIAKIMGVSKSTLCRKFGSARLVELFKGEVNSMVRSTPPDRLEQVVYNLYYENHFDEEEVARLLCVPESDVVQILRDATGKVVNRLDVTAVRRLFEG
jgi:AraC-like DNA-binding protein